jgi:hypothetical protein
MKKLISLICALAIVLGVNAAPQLNKKGVTKMTRIEKKGDFTVKKAAKDLPFKKAVAKKGERYVGGKTFTPAKSLKNANVAKALKATTNEAISSYAFQDYGDGNIYYLLRAEDGLEFYFDFYLENEEATDIEYDVTYTMADLGDGDYSFIFTEEEEYISFTEVTFLKTIANEKERIDVTILDENGDEWILLYDEASLPEAPAGGEFIADEGEGTYYSDGDIQYVLTCTDAKMVFYFDILLPEGEKDVVSGQVYTLDDMDARYTAAAFDDRVEIIFASCSFVKTVAEDGSWKVEASAVDTDNNNWSVSFAGEAYVPEVKDLEMASYSEKFYAADNDVYVVMSDEAGDHYFVFDIILPEGLTELESGVTYTLDDMDATYSKGLDYEKYAYVYYAAASFTKTIAEDGSFTVVATVEDTNGDIWNLSYEQGAPEVREEALTLVIGGTQTGSGATVFQAYNEDSTTIAVFYLLSSNAEGDFEASDFYAYYTYVAYKADGSITYYSLAGDADIHIALDEEANTYHITGTMLTANDDDPTDQILFTLDLTVAAPAPIIPEKQEELTITNAELIYDGEVWQLQGMNDEETRYIALVAYEAEVAGHFETESFDDYYSYVAFIDEAGEAEDYYDLRAADITIEVNDGIATLTGTMVGLGEESGEAIEFILNITAEVSEDDGCTQYDAEEGNDFIVDFADVEIDDQYAEAYSVWFVGGEDEDGNYLSLQIYAPEGLAAGEYPVLEDSEEAFVVAGELDLNEGSIYGSFAGVLTSNGQIQVPLWCLVAGTVTLNENGSVDVDAVNCAGAIIKCHLGDKEEAIDNVDAAVKATKRVVNGQLVIEKNGVIYNAQGAIVK